MDFPASHSPSSDDAARPPAVVPTLVAEGMGGRVELVGEQIHLLKGGVFGFFASMFGMEGFVEKTIWIGQLTAIEIIRPVIFHEYIRFSYAGGPSATGHHFRDAMAENALMMNMFDNRPFYRLKEEIERIQAARVRQSA
ncbi:MAG: hypothetical protein HY057_10745 [Rhodospirillales bacterium]|nr:hypothetical protein [Rhodospirillales bacterium]